MIQDINFKIICDEIVNNIPIESIILCGSRAKGLGVTEDSDYDILIVMKTYTIPLYLSKLKKIEKRLSQNLGINITVNPLLTFRIKNARGNLFLFKVKREGITLYGKDYIKELNSGKIEDIPPDKYFSFLFSAAKELIQNFDTKFLKENTGYEERKKVVYDASKAIIHCAELRLLLNNCYETNINNLILKLSEIESIDFLNDVKTAIDIRYNNMDFDSNSLKFWFRAKDHVIETFGILMKNNSDENSENIEYLVDRYFENKNNNRIKNVQYFFLVLLYRKKKNWRVLTTVNTVEDMLRMSLLFLLTSIRIEDCIDKEMIEKSFKLLQKITDVQYLNDYNILWNNIRREINISWPFGCTVVGI